MSPETFLQILLAVIGFLLVFVLMDIKSFLKETREKLDDHCEDFDRHYIPNRRSTDRNPPA